MVTVSSDDLVPLPDVLPHVLPTDRLNKRGMATRPLRDDYRKSSDLASVLTVAGALLQTFGVVAVAAVLNTWWAYLVAFVWMGRGHCLLNILGHEAAHRLLFSKRQVNDLVGRWLLGYPSYQAMIAYRRAHFAHHRDEMGPNEPDMGLYVGYPISRASWWRKMRRDLFGNSALKNFKSLLGAARKGYREALQIVGLHVVALALLVAVGRPVVYLIWIGSWSSLWRVSNRIRSVAEHGGMTRSEDRRLTTHVVRQTRLARLCITPYNTGWHLAHHADMAVPWRNLPRFHDELVASGWVVPGLEYPGYFAFLRVAMSGTEGTATPRGGPVASSMLNFD